MQALRRADAPSGHGEKENGEEDRGLEQSLFEAAPGTERRGRAAEAHTEARSFRLEEDRCDQHDRDKDLADIEGVGERHLFPSETGRRSHVTAFAFLFAV